MIKFAGEQHRRSTTENRTFLSITMGNKKLN